MVFYLNNWYDRPFILNKMLKFAQCLENYLFNPYTNYGKNRYNGRNHASPLSRRK